MDLAVLHPAAEKIHLPEKVHHEFGLGIVENFVGRADLLDAPFVHHHHAVGQFEGFFLIVRDKHAGHVDFIVQAAQPAAQFLPHFGVQSAERFVQKQHFRLDGQRPGQRHALPLSAGKLMRIASGHSVELHQFQQVVARGG